jgi:hypothetical protein
MSDEALNKLIEELSKNPSKDFTIRNALMELRGLRAAIKHTNPAVFIKEDGTKLVFYAD